MNITSRETKSRDTSSEDQSDPFSYLNVLPGPDEHLIRRFRIKQTDPGLFRLDFSLPVGLFSFRMLET